MVTPFFPTRLEINFNGEKVFDGIGGSILGCIIGDVLVFSFGIMAGIMAGILLW